MFCIIIIAINILVFFILPSELKPIFAINIFFIELDYWWQLLSSMFLHSNFTHLALNMIVLYQFGIVLERFLGSLKFLLLYFIGGVLSSLLSAFYVYYRSFQDEKFFNLLGASGAICVLIGYYAFVHKNSFLGLLIAVLLMSFVPIFVGVNVAWYAHIFGFICGYMIARLRIIRWKKFIY